jgi:general secretion pathway protein G
MRTQKGFTLVEILIVVVILGILAAVVIPQFTEASTEAKTSSLCTDLQTVRSQIELYKVQHNDQMPGTVSGVSFTQALTGYTNVSGAIVAQGTAGSYGPYLQKIPSNQFAPTTIANVVDIGTTDPAAASATGGWFFNTSTGKFMAVDTVAHLSL